MHAAQKSGYPRRIGLQVGHRLRLKIHSRLQERTSKTGHAFYSRRGKLLILFDGKGLFFLQLADPRMRFLRAIKTPASSRA